MSTQIKLYGERNTNTNYMSKLIKLNLNVQEVPGTVPSKIMKLQELLPGNEMLRDLYFRFTFKNNLGWKHSCVNTVKVIRKFDIANSDIAFLTITKNPYSWLLSLYRRPYHQSCSAEIDFETFLQRPWKTTARDNTVRLLGSPAHLWNIKNASYIPLSVFNTLNITTESIIDDPKGIVDRISQQLSIKKLGEFVNYESSTKDDSKSSGYYRDYYRNEKWRDEISSDAIAIINKIVDKNLMVHFGYEIL